MDATLAWYSLSPKKCVEKLEKKATSATSAIGSGLNKSISLQHRLAEELACLGRQDAINIPSEPSPSSPSRHSCFKSEVQFLLFWLSKKPLTAKSLVGSDEAAFPLEDYLSNISGKSVKKQHGRLPFNRHFVNSQASSLGAAQPGHSRGCAATSKRRRTCWVCQWTNAPSGCATNAEDSQNAELKTS